MAAFEVSTEEIDQVEGFSTGAGLAKGEQDPILKINSNGVTKYDPDTNTIHWDPSSGQDVEGLEGKPDPQGGWIQSPALGLLGEIVHANQDASGKKLDTTLVPGTGGNRENMRKVKIESKVAKQLDEPTRGRYIGVGPKNEDIPKPIKTASPTCRQPIQ